MQTVYTVSQTSRPLKKSKYLEQILTKRTEVFVLVIEAYSKFISVQINLERLLLCISSDLNTKILLSQRKAKVFFFQ